MNTESVIGINKINLNALKGTKFPSSDKISQSSGDAGENIVISVPFDGYTDIICEVRTLANVIECLSMDSCRSDKDNFEMISAVSRIIQKILPDTYYIDDLIFDNNSSNQNFKNVKDLK